MNEPTTLPEILAHFRTAYAPKPHHPELTPVQQVRINQIDAYRAQRQPRLKQNADQQVWLILVMGYLAVACIGVAIGIAMSTEWMPGNQMEVLRAYKATQIEG